MGAGARDEDEAGAGATEEGGHGAADEGGAAAHPPLVGAGAAEVVEALEAGSIIAVPAVGGYSLAVRAGSPGAERGWWSWRPTPTGPTLRSATLTACAR